MAPPVNGIAGNPAKSIARPPNRTIVPVLPLNYPQRPANTSKQPPAPPTTVSPKKAQNGVRPAEEKPAPHIAAHDQGAFNGTSTKAGPSSVNSLAVTAPSAAPVQVADKPVPTGPVDDSNEREKGM